MLIARCRRGSRPAVSWCVLPCIWSYCPPWLPCPALVPMLHVLPVYARPEAPRAHAVMLAAPVLCGSCRAVSCLAHVRPLPHACRIHVYMSTCLHVYTFTYLHVNMFTNHCLKWLIYQQNRQTRTGAIKPRPSYYQPFVSLSRSNNSFCLPASACRFIYSDNAASSSSPLPLPFAFT